MNNLINSPKDAPNLTDKNKIVDLESKVRDLNKIISLLNPKLDELKERNENITILNNKLLNENNSLKKDFDNFKKEKEKELIHIKSSTNKYKVKCLNYEQGGGFLEKPIDIYIRLQRLGVLHSVVSDIDKLNEKIKKRIDEKSKLLLISGVVRSDLINIPSKPDFRIWGMSVLKELYNYFVSIKKTTDSQYGAVFLCNVFDLINNEFMRNNLVFYNQENINLFSFIKNLVSKYYSKLNFLCEIPKTRPVQRFIEDKRIFVDEQVNEDKILKTKEEIKEILENIKKTICIIYDKVEKDYFEIKKDLEVVETKETMPETEKERKNRTFKEAEKRILNMQKDK